MHNFDAIFSHFFGGRPPAPQLRERVTPSPILAISALRATVSQSASFLYFEMYANDVKIKK